MYIVYCTKENGRKMLINPYHYLYCYFITLCMPGIWNSSCLLYFRPVFSYSFFHSVLLGVERGGGLYVCAFVCVSVLMKWWIKRKVTCFPLIIYNIIIIFMIFSCSWSMKHKQINIFLSISCLPNQAWAHAMPAILCNNFVSHQRKFILIFLIFNFTFLSAECQCSMYA